MKGFIAVYFLLIATPIIASETELVWERVLLDQSKEYLVQTQEDGRTFLRLYREPHGKMQDLIFETSRLDPKAILKMRNEIFLKSRAATWSEVSDQKIAEPHGPITEVQLPRWTATESWSKDWEIEYSNWITTLPHTAFFQTYGIATDCADVPIALRWIFSRINKLPVGFRLAGTNELMTHETMREKWAQLPTHTDWDKDRQFLASLDYLLDNTYTHSLFKN